MTSGTDPTAVGGEPARRPPGLASTPGKVAGRGPRRAKPTVARASVKYGAVGVAGIAVNLAVLHLLHGVAGLGFTRSSAVATEAAIITNYLGNELWTFHVRRLSWRRLVQFNLAALLALVVTVTLATIVKEFVHPLVAQLAGIGAGAAVNFSINFGWTWRR